MPTETINTETGTHYSRAELKATFELVENKNNWKMPIDKEVWLSALEVNAVYNAVIFFAGCAPKFTCIKCGIDGKNLYRVTAPGYYKAVGA